MTRRRERGMTLMEVVVTLSVFGVFIFIIVILTAEMTGYDKRYPVNYMTNPQVAGALSRIRRDVLDSAYFPIAEGDYRQTPKTLIVETITPAGTTETIVWDFTDPELVKRKRYVAHTLQDEWASRGLPGFVVDSTSMPDSKVAVRILAMDKKKNVAIDQIFTPRKH